MLLAALTAVGVLVATVQAFGVLPSDFVGVASALVGAFEAWRQADQDQQTAETYRQRRRTGKQLSIWRPSIADPRRGKPRTAAARRTLLGRRWWPRRSG